jgi:hypothetical protein
MTAKGRGWVVGALVAGGAVMAMRGCLSKPPPDARLAGRFDDLCDIARDNVKTPEKGVRALGKYMVKHTDDIFGEWGGTIAEIERITDDDKHDDRARVARDRLRAPLRACEDDWMRFAEAVDGDAAASELVANAAERLNRTFEIILSSNAHFDWKHLPQQLEAALR